MRLKRYFKECQNRINVMLDDWIPTERAQPAILHEAMRYCALNGGKRLRSILIYSLGQHLQAKEEVLDHIAASIELIHTASLVHDDLPAIDNGNLRRGQATCHKVYGSAIATLTGDALYTLAFNVMAQLGKRSLIPAENYAQILCLLASAIGSRGLVGGEVLDIYLTNNEHLTEKKLEMIYYLKTSKFISVGLLMAAIAAGYTSRRYLNHLYKFGVYFGNAFQIHDDIIGIESTTEILGKDQNADVTNNKIVYPLLVGIEYAKQKEKNMVDKALQNLCYIGLKDCVLEKIAVFAIQRKH